MRRSALAALTTASAVVATTLGVAPTASAAVTQGWTWPSSGTVAVQGHGWGHGHGMSQWGAYGAAVKGLTYRQIMAFYYPGTSVAKQAEPTLRVLVIPDDDDVTEISPTAGVGVTTDHGTVADLPRTSATYGAISRWRAVRSGSALRLQYRTGSTWHDATVGRSLTHRYVQFDPASSGTVRLVLPGFLREYRGQVRANLAGSGVQTVVNSTVTNYLRSVVPSEMPSSWRAEALRSQAVAARTYALFDRASKSSTSAYDTCDTTSCQVFSGVRDLSTSGAVLRTYEASASDAAVTATAGYVVTYAGRLAFTQFSASNGGWTTAGGQPYLVAKADPYDGVVANSSHSWTDSISASTVQAAYPSIGTLRSITLTRDGHGEWGGRITAVVLQGSKGDASASGSSFSSRVGLKHSWWAPSNSGWSGYDLVVGPGDWDGDRYPDLIARQRDGRLYLLTGPASPLGARRSIGTGFQAFTSIVAPGDWDGDRMPDLLARRTNGDLYLYRGTGTGGFASWRRVGTGFQAFTSIVAPGDWDGDRKPDLLARRANGDLYLYRGNGTGGFAGWRRIGVGFQAFTLMVGPGDWDGDRAVDLLARRTNGELYLYRGNGRGGFASWRRVGTGWQGFDVISAAGPLDRDAAPDLVARTPAGNAYLYPGNGTGGFRPRSAIGTP